MNPSIRRIDFLLIEVYVSSLSTRRPPKEVRTSDGAATLHVNLLIVVEPGGAGVCENIARRDHPRSVQFGPDLKNKLLRYIREYKKSPRREVALR